MASCCHYLLRAARAVVHVIEDLVEAITDEVNAIADDTLVQRGLEADLGLPPGALDR